MWVKFWNQRSVRTLTYHLQSISPKLLGRILSSGIWLDYERGHFSQEVCYARVEETFSVTVQVFSAAIDQARRSFQSTSGLLSFIRELKLAEPATGNLQIFGMLNISLPDYTAFRSNVTVADWGVLDEVFVSSGVGHRKTDYGFYNYVIKKANIPTTDRVIFVDDDLDHCMHARCMGWQVIRSADPIDIARRLGNCLNHPVTRGRLYDRTWNLAKKLDCVTSMLWQIIGVMDPIDISRRLRNLLHHPVNRGRGFLTRNAKKMHSVTTSGIVIEENFAQLLILEATGDR